MTNPVLRDAKGKLLPGTRGINPRGRPPTGYAASEMIRELMETGDRVMMRALVRQTLLVALRVPLSQDVEYLRKCHAARQAGQPEPPPPDGGEVVVPTIEQARQAAEFLMAWGYKKPAQEVDVRAGALDAPEIDYASLPMHVLEAIEAAARAPEGGMRLPPVAAIDVPDATR